MKRRIYWVIVWTLAMISLAAWVAIPVTAANTWWFTAQSRSHYLALFFQRGQAGVTLLQLQAQILPSFDVVQFQSRAEHNSLTEDRLWRSLLKPEFRWVARRGGRGAANITLGIALPFWFIGIVTGVVPTTALIRRRRRSTRGMSGFPIAVDEG